MSVHVEQRGPALVLTIDRPQKRNAIDPAVHDGLSDAIAGLGDARAVILTGRGRSFIAGGDLELIHEAPFDETLALCHRMTTLLERLEALPVPVFAAINGHAFGGGLEIALACDYRVAAPGARLSFRQAAMGLTTGWGAATRLRRLVPRGVAMRLTMTAEVLDAERARDLHLVEEVADDPLERCLEIASMIAAQPASAIAAFKDVLRVAYSKDAAHSAEHEWQVFQTLWGAADHASALATYFAEK